MSHALLARLYRAAIEGVSPFPRTHERVQAWLDARASSPAPASPAAPVHVLALGKAAPEMARGALHALAERDVPCAGGIVVAAHRPDSDITAPLPLRVGDHPIPDIGSLAAADAIAAAVSQVGAGDDVLVLLSGGTTALCAAPCAELTAFVGHPAEAQQVIAGAMSTMMTQGMAIHEMNAIRRRLLRWGAGRLATALHARGARAVHVMAVSDVVGDDPAVIGSAPCTADPLDQATLLAICDAHGLRSEFDITLSRALGLSGQTSVPITPPPATHPAFARVTYEIVAGNADAREAAARAAYDAGISEVVVADVPLEGEAEWLGATIADLAVRHAASAAHGAVLVWGGEPTVYLEVHRVLDDEQLGPGDVAWGADVSFPPGGRMQALALEAALRLEQLASTNADARRITLLAAGTDGRDGPTDAAGAIVDAGTPMDARRAGRDPSHDRDRYDSHRALDAAGALLRTGPTGTNVMDVVIVAIGERPASRAAPASP